MKQLCKSLRLAYVADHFEEIPYDNKEQYLYDVLMQEYLGRQESKSSKLMKKARFRELK